MSDLQIKWLGGNCPVQAEGTIDGRPFYFRARGEHWSFGVGDDPVGEPDWYHEEEYGDEPFVAGWMSEDEARTFINKAADAYANDIIARRIAEALRLESKDYD